MAQVENRDPSRDYRVVPWTDLGTIPGLATLPGQTMAELEAELKALPDGIWGVALVHGERVAATGLVVDREIPSRGLRRLAQLTPDPGEPAEEVLRLVHWAEEDGQRLGAQHLHVSLPREKKLSVLLQIRGYRLVETFLQLRQDGLLRRTPPLPDRVQERGIEAVDVDAFLAVSNEAFKNIPGSLPLTAADWERLASSPEFFPDLVRVLVDPEGPIGFLRGTLAPDGKGEVEAIGVLTRARGRHLGLYLLRRCEELLRSRGATHVELFVASSNSRAVKLYQSEGYTVVLRHDMWGRKLDLERAVSGRA